MRQLPAVFDELSTIVKTSSASEWYGSCPRCGGKDRFVMLESSNATGGPFAFCRQCDYKWWPESEKWEPISEQQKAEIAAERARRTEEERVRIERERQKLASTPISELFYANLMFFPYSAELWRERYGVNEWALNYYRLGYCPEFEYWHQDERHTSATLTIPYFAPATRYKLTGLRHRLLDDNPPGGKYRPHKAGLGQPLFYANLNRLPESLPFVLLVEGAIKALVIWQTVMHAALTDLMCAEEQWFMHNVQVIGLPGIAVADSNLPALEAAQHLYLALDPDAFENRDKNESPADRLRNKLGPQRCKFVHLPGKPDDLIVQKGLTVRDLVYFMKKGRK